MADWGQIELEDGRNRPEGCMVCEAMLPEAVDGVLTEAERRAFDRHVAGCAECAREYEEAERGAAWLGLLKQQAPEPRPALLERILAQTSGLAPAEAARARASLAGSATLAASLSSLQVAGAPPRPVPAAKPVSTPESGWAASPARLPVGSRRERVAARWSSAWNSAWSSVGSALSVRGLLQPRLAMTAAMLFFSVALTLNLTGVKLGELHASSLSPSSLRRSLADRSSAVVRSFQNSSVVYQMESRVSDLRSDWSASDAGPGAAPQTDRDGDGAEPPDSGAKPPSGAPKSDKPFGSSRLSGGSENGSQTMTVIDVPAAPVTAAVLNAAEGGL